MGLRSDKKQWLIGKLGRKRVEAIEEALGTLGKELEAGGIAFKDFEREEVESRQPVDAYIDDLRKLGGTP